MALNLLFAGHDTSASTLFMLLRFLKLRPETLQKLREEQSKVLSTHADNMCTAVSSAFASVACHLHAIDMRLARSLAHPERCQNTASQCNVLC